MKVVSLGLLISVIAGLNAMPLTKEEIESKQLELMDESICVDCFERRIAHGDTYWDSCNFCTCDRSVAVDERCSFAGCYFSPCPRVKGEIKEQMEYIKDGSDDSSWNGGGQLVQP